MHELRRIINMRQLVLIILLLTGSCLGARGQGITCEQFLNYLALSRQATGDTPVRSKVTIESSDTETGPWKPYSAWINESILPDRSHLIYTRPRTEEYIHIGDRSFSRIGGVWSEGKAAIQGNVDRPAGPRACPAEMSYIETADEAGMRTVTIRKLPLPHLMVPENKSFANYFSYSFDKEGVLIKLASTAWNGTNRLLRTESYEYDLRISIESPVN